MMIKILGRIVFFLLFPFFLYGNIEFTQKISRENFYLNETIKVTLQLRISKDFKIDQVYFEDFDVTNFWTQKLSDKTTKENENYIFHTYEYLLDAKDIGKFIIPKQKIEISSEDIRQYAKWKKIYSNELEVNIKTLFENLPIQGNYDFFVKTNKEKIKKNESIYLSLFIKGFGNIQDIKPFNLNLQEQIVYEDKPKLDFKFINETYKGDFEQNFLIVANKSFTIPSFEFEYFNIQKGISEKITTKPIFIEVENEIENLGDDYKLKYLFALIGFIFGLLFLRTFKYFKNSYKYINHPLVVKIKKAKNNKELYEILIKNNEKMIFDEYIKILEENIYKNKKNKVDKKKILKKLK